MFVRTTAIDKMLALTARKKVIQGGTSAGKTHGIVPILINKAASQDNLKITIVAESIPAVKDGAVDIFKTVMNDTGRWRESGWIGNPMEYTFSKTKSRIQFKSFDTAGKAKAAGKRDILFLNEANHIDYEIADMLITRSEEIWIDFNPDKSFWVHEEILTEPNVDFIKLTYLDNEAIPKATLEELDIKMRKAFYDPLKSWGDPKNVKSKYWKNWCKVYLKGEIGNLQGACIKNWTQIDNIPDEARLIRRGLDFGWSPDPMAACAVFQWNDAIILDELFYRTQMGMNEVIAECKSFDGGEVRCDHSQPILIQQLKTAGINAVPCVKGNGSVEYGLDQLNQQPIYVTSRSLNLIKELRSYIVDPKTGVPIDAFNHLVDAARYAFVTEPKPKTTIRSSKY